MILQSIIIEKSNDKFNEVFKKIDRENLKTFDGHNIRKIEETPNYIIFKILPKCRFEKDSFIAKKYVKTNDDHNGAEPHKSAFFYIYGSEKKKII